VLTLPRMMDIAHSTTPKRRKTPIGGQIFVIVVFSVIAGSHLERALLLRYHSPVQPYGWMEDLILGIGLLIGAIALAVRLRRDARLHSDSQMG